MSSQQLRSAERPRFLHRCCCQRHLQHHCPCWPLLWTAMALTTAQDASAEAVHVAVALLPPPPCQLDLATLNQGCWQENYCQRLLAPGNGAQLEAAAGLAQACGVCACLLLPTRSSARACHQGCGQTAGQHCGAADQGLCKRRRGPQCQHTVSSDAESEHTLSGQMAHACAQHRACAAFLGSCRRKWQDKHESLLILLETCVTRLMLSLIPRQDHISPDPTLPAFHALRVSENIKHVRQHSTAGTHPPAGEEVVVLTKWPAVRDTGPAAKLTAPPVPASCTAPTP